MAMPRHSPEAKNRKRTMSEPTPEQHAKRALRNAITRAEQHIDDDRLIAACIALQSGQATARSWLDGTHK